MGKSKRSRRSGVLLVILGSAVGALLLAASVPSETGACGTAVSVWLKRGQLPLPPLSAGPRDLVLRASRFTACEAPADLEGCYRVALYRRESGDRLVAEYDVGWHGDPKRYRLVRATDRLNDRRLRVGHVPELSAAEVGAEPNGGGYKWNPFR